MATNVWISTSSTAYGTAGNWSLGAAPIATNDVIIPAGTASIAGSDQSAVSIASFRVMPGYTGTIGSSTAYLKLTITGQFEFAGTGVAYIDLQGSTISPQVFDTASVGTGLRGLYLLGSALTTLNVVKGKVGLAMSVATAETSTVATARVAGSGGSLWLWTGVTLTTYLQEYGDGEIRCAATTVTAYSGTLLTRHVGAITTMNNYGAVIRPESTGTITTCNAFGGTTDFLQSGAARTVTTLKQNPGGIVLYDPAVLTITTRAAPDYSLRLTATTP